MPRGDTSVGSGTLVASHPAPFVLDETPIASMMTPGDSGMTLAEIARKPAGPGAFANDKIDRIVLETAATTRLLEEEGILDYSGHVSTRIPGRDAFVIQIGSTSRA